MADEAPCKKVKHDSDVSEHGNATDVTKLSHAAISVDCSKYSNSLDRCKEVKAGMTCYASDVPRFSGIVKQRFEDFMVREIDVNGELVYLTDVDPVDPVFSEPSSSAVECPISDETLARIRSFINDNDRTARLTLDADDCKEHRTRVHKYLRESFLDLEAETVDLGNGKKAIGVRLKESFDKRGGRRKEGTWPKSVPDYCHFVLMKQNRDTMDAISLISKLAKVPVKSFSYAGTKDRRATTVQKVAAYRVLSKKLAGLNRSLRNVRLGNFTFQREPLKLGDLRGNEFTLVVRDIDADIEQVRNAMDSLKANGFVNYFGLQRFGTGSVPTQEIGKALLLSDYKLAVNLILQERENDPGFVRQAKRIWSETGDANAAWKCMKNSKQSIEGKLLWGLSTQKEGCWLNSIQAIPRNTRLLYLHAYQSWIWNMAASRRIEMFGLKTVIGDLVLAKEEDARGHDSVRAITAEDVSQGKFAIFDVVLPLPGYDVVYPSNQIGEIYKQLLESDGFHVDKMRHRCKEFALSGAYRNLMVTPEDLVWSIVNYDDHTIPLIGTDLDRIPCKAAGPEVDPEQARDAGSLGKCVQGYQAQDRVDGVDSRPCLAASQSDTICQGAFRALKMQFRLPSSAYATSLLREVLKAEVSFEAQKKLNEDFLARHANGVVADLTLDCENDVDQISTEGCLQESDSKISYLERDLGLMDSDVNEE